MSEIQVTNEFVAEIVLGMFDRLSAAGANLRNDDNPPRVWGDAILRSLAKIYQYLVKRYDWADLLGNYWVRDRGADIASYLLCGRRGNARASSIVADYKEAIADLKEIRADEADVPDANPRRIDGPVMSNVFTLVSPNNHVRVHTTTSTTTGGQVRDYSQRLDLSIMTDSWLNYPMG